MQYLYFLFFCFILVKYIQSISLRQAGSDLNDLLTAYHHQSGGSLLTQISINAQGDSDAIIKLIQGPSRNFMLGLLFETGSFVIKNERLTMMETTTMNEIIFGSENLRTKSLRILKNFEYRSNPQWKLFHLETYESEAQGWTINSVTTCGKLALLGGYDKMAGGTNQKEFFNIPLHNMIRIVAQFHFIDKWQGENAFLKLNIGRERSFEYVWIDKYDFTQSSTGSNVCGNSVPENRLSATIDLFVPHIDETLIIQFGSTLVNNAQENSWGISSLQLLIR